MIAETGDPKVAILKGYQKATKLHGYVVAKLGFQGLEDPRLIEFLEDSDIRDCWKIEALKSLFDDFLTNPQEMTDKLTAKDYDSNFAGSLFQELEKFSKEGSGREELARVVADCNKARQELVNEDIQQRILEAKAGRSTIV